MISCIIKIVTIVALTNALACSLFSDSLVGHWTFDETSGMLLGDSSEGGKDGVLANFDDDTTHWVKGKKGGAIKFDGVDDTITIPHIDYSADGRFTIMFWYNCQSVNGERYRYMFSHGESESFGNNSIFAYFTKRMEFRTRVIDSDDDISGAFDLSEVNEAPADGDWHHYALVTSSEGSTIFIDGKKMGKHDRGGDPLLPATDIMLGSRIFNMKKRYFDGMLDDLRIYDYPVSEKVVSDIFNGSK